MEYKNTRRKLPGQIKLNSPKSFNLVTSVMYEFLPCLYLSVSYGPIGISCAA